MPSPVVAALLRFVASENEPLAGDLAEELRAGRSSRWFWSQLLRTVLVIAVRRCAAGFSGRTVQTMGVLTVVAAAMALGVWSVTLVRHGFIEGVIVLSLAGGALVALLIFRTSATPSGRLLVADPFARDPFAVDTLNCAHIRVAGVGGAGLVLASLGVALQYPLTGVVLALGLSGGLLGGVAAIFVRKRRLSPR